MKQSIRDQIPDRGGFYYSNELYLSKAYQSLTPAARNLLHSLLGELKYRYIKSSTKKQRKDYQNNGSVSFTAIHFRALYGSCSQTYLSARNKLIEVGLINQIHRGGSVRGDRATYKVLCVDGVRIDFQRWRQYPEKNWSNKVPIYRNNSVGKKTRWKKGQSGRGKIHPK